MPSVPCSPTVQPLWVVQPDAVCEVGGLTPDLSYGDLGIFLGGGQTEKFVPWLSYFRHTGDAPSNRPKVAGVFPPRNVGLEVNLSLSLENIVQTTDLPCLINLSTTAPKTAPDKVI